MKSRFAVIWVIVALVFTMPLFGAGDAAAGKELYSKKCASCHGAAGEGKDSIAKMMKVELRHLGAEEVQAKSDADLKKVTFEGTGKMKGVAGLDPKAGDDIVAYLRTLTKK